MSLIRLQDLILLNTFDISLKEEEIIAYIDVTEFNDEVLLIAYELSLEKVFKLI